MGVQLQGLEEQSFATTENALTARLGRERLHSIEREAAEVPLEGVVDDALAPLEPEPGRATGQGRRARAY